MRGISPVQKQFLYYKGQRIIDHLKEAFPTAKIIGSEKTANRWETLQEVKHLKDCWIIDCDIVLPSPRDYEQPETDQLHYFTSQKPKYGSIKRDMKILGGKLVAVAESGGDFITEDKCSGLYFVKSVAQLLENMTDKNSLASGMIGAKCQQENYIVKLGDVEDYMEACQ